MSADRRRNGLITHTYAKWEECKMKCHGYRETDKLCASNRPSSDLHNQRCGTFPPETDITQVCCVYPKVTLLRLVQLLEEGFIMIN